MALEQRHIEALSHIYAADRAWADRGNEPRSFILTALGGMRRAMDHPGWNEHWPVPAAGRIDDLAEEGMLRVEVPEPQSVERTFEMAMAGREKIKNDLAAAQTPQKKIGFN
jgi:hypothetical protein